MADTLASISQLIAATGALGTGSYGLVDALKSLGGWGPSARGLKLIETKLKPFGAALNELGGAPWETLRANWLNGVPKGDQKAIAKSLIRLCLTAKNAATLATATGLDSQKMGDVASKIDNGTALGVDEINFLGHFDAIVSAILDAAYERADQQYRNTAKALAMLIAALLAIFGRWVILQADQSPPSFYSYLHSSNVVMPILVGLISTPLAPVAKDLSSTLQTAVKAMSIGIR